MGNPILSGPFYLCLKGALVKIYKIVEDYSTHMIYTMCIKMIDLI